MGAGQNTKNTKRKKKWKTVEKFWNAGGKVYFLCPDGVKVRVKYGAGWFSIKRSKKTLNCTSEKKVTVRSALALGYGRVQIKNKKNKKSVPVTYYAVPSGSPVGFGSNHPAEIANILRQIRDFPRRNF